MATPACQQACRAAFATNKQTSLLPSLHWAPASAATNLDIWQLHEIVRSGTKSANFVVSKATSQRLAVNGKRRYRRLTLCKTHSRATTVLSVNVERLARRAFVSLRSLVNKFSCLFWWIQELLHCQLQRRTLTCISLLNIACSRHSFNYEIFRSTAFFFFL